MRKVIAICCVMILLVPNVLAKENRERPVSSVEEQIAVGVGLIGMEIAACEMPGLLLFGALLGTVVLAGEVQNSQHGDQSNQHPDIAKALGYSKVFSEYTVALYDLANLSKADLNALVKFIEEGTPDVLPKSKSGEGTVSLMSDHQVFVRINTGKKLLVLHPACIKSADSQEPTYTHYVKAQK